MNRKEYLRIVRKQIRFIFDRDAVEKELNQHLCDSMDDLMDAGLSREEAELLAVEQMGDPIAVGKLLNQEHHPLLGYLWTASNAVLLLLSPLVILLIISFGHGIINTITPVVLENSVETYSVGIELELPTHSVKIDNICRNKEGQYCITYRAWIKYDYSRAGWSSNLFYFEDSTGEQILGGRYESNNLIGCHGYKDFDWPEDSILNIVGRDGQKIEINLQEYCDETR